jgi:hypothetical protein
MSMVITSYRSLIIVAAVMILLAGYNFINAAWTPATGTPPANNTEAPLNVSSTTQAKSGNLQANIFAATTEMRANRYCDALGTTALRLQAPARVVTRLRWVGSVLNQPIS